jgi:hypothetical protein
MRTTRKGLFWFASICAAVMLLPSSSRSQQTAANPLSEDNLSPAEFTAILKEAWTFLKEETDNYQKTIGEKSEFETTTEFEKHIVEARRQYLANIMKYVKDKKLDQRVLGVLLNASLLHYDADNQLYSVSCPTVVDAPYNIPSILTEVPRNSYVALADSIKMGYRTSSIYLKFSPYFRWQVARDVAKAAKDDEKDIYFKVRFKVQMGQGTGTKEARFSVVPQQILLVNQKTNTTYWQQSMR